MKTFGPEQAGERANQEVESTPELKSKRRARIPTRKFGLPEKARSAEAKKETGNYPMPDRTHAANAKSRAKQQWKKGKLSRDQYDKIVAKADRMLKKDDK